MNENTVSMADMQNHCGWYRWKIERESSNRFVSLWSQVAATNAPKPLKEALVNLLWASTSFERAYDNMEENAARIERMMRDGVPPAMALTGPYENSLSYLFGQSMWMDLADLLIWHRTLAERLVKSVKNAVPESGAPVIRAVIDSEISIIKARRLPEFGNRRAIDLANKLLHQHWHPTAPPGLSFGLYLTQGDPPSVGFSEDGTARTSIRNLVEEVLAQVTALVLKAVGLPPSPVQQGA